MNKSLFLFSLSWVIMPTDVLGQNFFFLSCGLSLILLSSLSKTSIEIYFLYGLQIVGFWIILFSKDWFSIYLGLECQSFSLLMLIGQRWYSLKAMESALKYFMLMGMTSAVFLLGIVMIWSETQTILMEHSFAYVKDNYSQFFYYNIGMILILMALMFKLGLVPYHVWVLDIYEGSPWSLMLWISTLPKLSVFVIFLKCNTNNSLLLACGILSILMGSMGAFNQSKLKSIFAYSSVAHIGFVMIAWTMWESNNLEAGWLYLILYLINNMGILILFSLYPKPLKYISDLSPWGSFSDWWGWVFLIFLFSLAGIPPLAGFLGKWGVFCVLMAHNHYYTLFLLMLGTVISVGYYLRLAQHIYIQQWSSYYVWKVTLLPPTHKKSFFLYWVLGYSVFILLTLIWCPNVVWSLLIF